MTIFGSSWEGHPDVFFKEWRRVVQEKDLVMVPGDLSWAMTLQEAKPDLEAIANLPGRKVILRGNHDYWWPSISKLRAALPDGMWVVQNDAVIVDDVVIAGTRGWICPGSHGFGEEDQKIYLRELHRLDLSLKAASLLAGKRFVVMLHYPPTNSRLEPSGFTERLIGADPDIIVYGHLHNEHPARVPKLGNAAVHFVAADALGFTPKMVGLYP
jgi:predicted phosphohydrolase